MRKGCWRSALEICKFILYLDFENDPMGMLLVLDFLALKSGEFGYLGDFYGKHKGRLGSYPNWLYTVALASFQQDLSSDELLKAAVVAFPGVVARLSIKCGFGLDYPAGREELFSPQDRSLNESQRIVANFEQMYAERSHLCWKSPGTASWVIGNLGSIGHQDTSWQSALQSRRDQFKVVPRGLFRHLLMADLEHFPIFMPPSMSREPIKTYNLLPPLTGRPSYIDDLEKTLGERKPRQERRNPVRLFFESLLPSFSVRGPNQTGQLPRSDPIIEEVESSDISDYHSD